MKYLRIDNAIEGFVGYAKIHGLATSDVANSKIANLAYLNLKEAYDYIKSQNALDELKILLQHQNVKVRVWAARYLLPIYEKESLAVLEEIVKGNLHSLTAEMTIEEWKKGNLIF